MCLQRIHIVLQVDISIQKTVGRENQEMRMPTSYISENPLSMVLRGNLKKGMVGPQSHWQLANNDRGSGVIHGPMSGVLGELDILSNVLW